jgi:hypothetical protein
MSELDPGTGIRCFFDPVGTDSGYEIGLFRIPDLGYRSGSRNSDTVPDPGTRIPFRIRIPDPTPIILRA